MLVYSPYIPIVVRTDYDGLLLSWGFHLFIDAIDSLLSCFVFGQFLTQPNSPSSSPLCMLRPKLFTDGHKMLIFSLKNLLWRNDRQQQLQLVLPFTGQRLSSAKRPVFTQQQQQS